MMSTNRSLSTAVLRDLASLGSLSSDWIQLWEKCAIYTPFQRPEWLLSWAEVFKPHRLHVIELRRDRDLIGLAPMFIYTSHGEKILAPLGAGITDYLDWLIMPGQASEAIIEILHHLSESQHEWDKIDLPDLPSWSPLLAFHTTMFARVSKDVCPAIYLSPKWTFREAIPERQRKNLRTAYNRTRKAGDAKIEVASLDTLPEFVDALFRLHTTRWQAFGMAGVLSDPSVQDFHRCSAPRLLQAGILRFYGLRFNGDLIAVLHSLWGQDSVCCYLQGFDPAYAYVSPGLQIIAAVVEDAVKNGKSVVDFLRGSETYKYSWGARDRLTTHLQMSRRELDRHVHPQHA